MPNNRKVTANDALRIALANPDIVVPPEALDALKQAKRSKYGNIKTDFDGLRFDSKAEMQRYGDLRILQMTGANNKSTWMRLVTPSSSWLSAGTLSGISVPPYSFAIFISSACVNPFFSRSFFNRCPKLFSSLLCCFTTFTSTIIDLLHISIIALFPFRYCETRNIKQIKN